MQIPYRNTTYYHPLLKNAAKRLMQCLSIHIGELLRPGIKLGGLGQKLSSNSDVARYALRILQPINGMNLRQFIREWKVCAVGLTM